MRLWPTEIEADLSRYHRRSIGDWWQGRMSSRELLVLLRHLPEDSAYKTESERDGEWSSRTRMIQTGVNELSKLRASYHGMHGANYEPVLWISPGELRAQADEEEVGQELQQELSDQFFGRS